MELSGKVKKIGEVQEISPSFRKRELVITTQEQYPQDILIEFVQDKVDLLNAYSLEQEIKVSINIRGREWINPEGVAKYFNSIHGWRIESVGGAAPQPAKNKGSEVPTASQQDAFQSSNDDDDLPF